MDEASVVKPIRINNIVKQAYVKLFERKLFFCNGTKSPKPFIIIKFSKLHSNFQNIN